MKSLASVRGFRYHALAARLCASTLLSSPLVAKTKNPKPQPADSLDAYLATARPFRAS